MAANTSADFLVEVGTEELPPKALRALMDAFANNLGADLDKSRLSHGEIKAFASPRRLAVLVNSLAYKQEDREVTQKGPPVTIAFNDKGEATPAGLAFAKKCGVDVNDLGREKTDRGEWLSHTALESGKATKDLIVGIVERALSALPIPRRMRWGDSVTEFVRPVHWLILLHGKEIISGSVLGAQASNKSRGHRFHAPGEIVISEPDKYLAALEEKGFVIADFDARLEKIVSGVRCLADVEGGSAVGDATLYDEVTALTEWPVPLTGTFDKAFLSLPDEVIVATLTNHQRYFPLRDKANKLLPLFITVANITSKEPQRVRNGNERVIGPRLADAAFFWKTDQQTPLGDRCDALANVVYQKGLGTLRDKALRVGVLATMFSDHAGVEPALVARAAILAKCDLLTGMVGEFPELQGTMGRYYAQAGGESAAVYDAIGDQYLPRFAGDELPSTSVGSILAVADKLDTLAGIFVLGKKPSGSRDPFGLRRAALGIIRILIEQKLDLNIVAAIEAAVAQQPASGEGNQETGENLYEFIVDRMRGYFSDQNARFSADVFEAVRVRRPSSLLDFAERLAAVASFLQLDAAASLAAANKRTANILRQAEFSDGIELDASLFEDDAETKLFIALQTARKTVAPLIERRAYTDALQQLAALRAPVDVFFDDVMVMTDDEAIRNNRLALLSELRSLFLDIADISRLTPEQE
ncbi:MAG: glycine--tRNA ligase subunit beta [Gammaproteobacteria bacterium]|nr:MAG: glycine--tRNA ligase subunit beta [Gammaproteobacteria bacterium]RLA35660.1 MAG: glycine--tRNA ligase subunit beta [Gammaproteobacteria bacterium]